MILKCAAPGVATNFHVGIIAIPIMKEFDRVRKILREAGYNSSFGVKNWKEGEKNVPGEEKEI